MAEQFIPEIMTELRKDIVKVPEVIMEASGIKIFGKLIRSIIFTTDIAIVRNTNAKTLISSGKPFSDRIFPASVTLT